MNARDAFAGANPIHPDAPAPLMREPSPAAPYPVQALGPLREAAEAAQDVSQAPMALAAQSALGVASLAAQALGDVETLTGGAAPCSLFALSIAQSGERKSTCDRLLMRPVHDYSRELADGYADALPSYRNRLDAWQAARAAILKTAKTDPEGARADLEVLGPEPEGPLLPFIIATDPTYEGLTKALALSRPALGIFSDEGGAFIGGHGMSQDNRLKTVAGLSGLWDATPVNRTRAGDGVATFFGRRLACHLMAQPVAAAGLLADPIASGQGFLARFLIVEPSSVIGTRLRHGHAPASDAALDHWASRVGDLLRRPLPLRDGTRNELDLRVVRLTPEARALLQAFADDVERAQAVGGDLEAVRPFASKAAEHAARLAGVLTLFGDPEAREVGAGIMADAITLADFYLGEAARLSEGAAVSAEVREAESLRRWLAERWPEPCVSPSDVAQYGPPALRDAPKARKLLRFLAGFGHLAELPDGAEIRGARRREAWRIVRGPG